MSNLTLKVKKLYDDVKLPVRATPGSGCYDIFAYGDPAWVYDTNEEGVKYLEYKTGLSIEPPEGYDAIILPRSSITKTHLILGNSVGYIDQDYTGELLFRFKLLSYYTEDPIVYKKGDRIGQIRLIKRDEFDIEEVNQLSVTERGEGGFGSTDR